MADVKKNVQRSVWVVLAVGLVWLWLATNTQIFRDRPPPLKVVTVAMLDTALEYPTGEQAYRVRDARRGRSFPAAPRPDEYCRTHDCPEFPLGYFTVQKHGEYFYFPLDRANQSGFPNEIIMPAFDYRAENVFEVRNSNGVIIKRISMENAGRSPYWFNLIPFIDQYEPDILPSSIRLVKFDVSWQSRGHHSDFIPSMESFRPSLEELREHGLKSYDSDFWLVKETEVGSGGVYGGACCFYSIELITKQPVYQGRRVYIKCGGSCSIQPITNNGLDDRFLNIRLIASFTQNYRDTRRDYQSFEEWLNAHGGYSLIEYDGFGLIDLILLADRMVEKTKTYDRDLIYSPQESEEIAKLRERISKNRQ